MQNKYVGDVGDFGKYGLLSALCTGDEHGPDLRLGVVWYLVSEKALEYLSEKSKGRFTACDDDLFAKLGRIVRARSVSAIERGDVLPRNTIFFGNPVSRTRREDWLERAADGVRDCDVVFLDPDMGLKESELGNGARRKEYAYVEEVSKFAEYGGARSVVIYHHLGRTKHEAQIVSRLTRLRQFPDRSPFALRFRSYSARAFLVVPVGHHRDTLLKRAKRFLAGPWGSLGLFDPDIIFP